MDATTDITDVYSDAERVRADSIRPGDSVFDVYGGRHAIVRVSIGKRWVTTTRKGGWQDRWNTDQIVTIVRA